VTVRVTLGVLCGATAVAILALAWPGASAPLSTGRPLWAAHFWRSTMTRVDARAGRTTATIRLRLPAPIAGRDDRFLPTDLAVGAGVVWVSTARGYVARIDPVTNRVAGMIATEPDATGPILAGPGSLWIGESLVLVRLDVATGRLTRRHVDGRYGRLSIGSLDCVGGALRIRGLWARRSPGPGGRPDYVATDRPASVRLRRARCAARPAGRRRSASRRPAPGR
jgi:hypothetical protein